MRINRAISLHTIIASAGGLILALCLTIVLVSIESAQRSVGIDSLALKDLMRMEDTLGEYLKLSDLVLASGETYLIEGTLTQSENLTKIVATIAESPIVKSSSVSVEHFGILIEKNNTRLNAVSTLDIDHQQSLFFKLLEESDRDGQILIQAYDGFKKTITRIALNNEQEIIARRKLLLHISALVAVIYLLSVILSWRWLVNNLVKPIQCLQFAAEEALTMDKPFEFNQSGPFEINRLTQSIKGFISSLEHKVEDRTFALRHRKQLMLMEIEQRRLAEQRTATALKLSKRATRQAEKANQAKSEFLAMMSHEIRTPLTGILGMQEILMGSSLTNDQLGYLELAQNSGLMLMTLINDILDFSKIEAGKLKMEIKDVSPVDIVNEVLQLIAPQAYKKNIEIVSYVDPNVPETIKSDATRLRQILTNLIGNAVKFTHEGGIVIRVKAKASGERYALYFNISDTGIGIDSRAKTKLFSKFTQMDSSTNRKYGGTGLGLAISKRLAEKLGGDIRVRSTKGVGSCFVYKTDASINPQDLKLSNTSSEHIQGLSLLLIDRNPVSRKVISQQLEVYGIQITAVSDIHDTTPQLQKSSGCEFTHVLIKALGLNDKVQSQVHQLRSKLNSKSTKIVLLVPREQIQSHCIKQDNFFSSILEMPVERNRLLQSVGLLISESPDNLGIITPKETLISNYAKNIRILVVEDSSTNQIVVKTMLERANFRVDIADNGFLALRAVKEKSYELILMDISMPDMDGFEATTRIRQLRKYRDIPIVAMTANTSSDDVERCYEVGMNDYLSKPYRKADLFAIIEKWCPKIVLNVSTAAIKPKATANDKGCLDKTVLAKIVSETSVDLVQTLAEMFVGETKSRLKHLEAAYLVKDYASIKAEVHAIKSSAGALGAHQLQSLAERVEKECMEDGNAVDELFPKLRPTAELTFNAFASLFPERTFDEASRSSGL